MHGMAAECTTWSSPKRNGLANVYQLLCCCRLLTIATRAFRELSGCMLGIMPVALLNSLVERLRLVFCALLDIPSQENHVSWLVVPSQTAPCFLVACCFGNTFLGISKSMLAGESKAYLPVPKPTFMLMGFGWWATGGATRGGGQRAIGGASTGGGWCCWLRR